MCFTIFMPLICALQMVSRVFLAILYAVEDLIKLVIQIIHGYLTTMIQACAAFPVYMAICFTKKCFGMCQLPACQSNSAIGCCDCSCIFAMIIAVIIIIFVLFYYNFYVEELFTGLKSKLGFTPFSNNTDSTINALKNNLLASKYIFTSLKSKICEFVYNFQTNKEVADQFKTTFNYEYSSHKYDLLKFSNVNETFENDIYDYLPLKEEDSVYHGEDNLTVSTQLDLKNHPASYKQFDEREEDTVTIKDVSSNNKTWTKLTTILIVPTIIST